MNAMTGQEYRHQAKARQKKFRQEQEARGYKSVSVYMSEPLRTELAKLNMSEGLNKQEALEHIYRVYVTCNATSLSSKTLDKPVDTELLKNDIKNTEILKAVEPDKKSIHEESRMKPVETIHPPDLPVDQDQPGLFPEQPDQGIDDIPNWKNTKAYRAYLIKTLPEVLDLSTKKWKDKAQKLNDIGIVSTTGKPWDGDRVRQVVADYITKK